MNDAKLSRSFLWLNITQFLGALNDNVFKLLVIFFLVGLLGDDHRTNVVATASTVFVIPFLLFSHAAGVLADRVSKRNVIVAMKIMEALVMALGCLAIYTRSPIALYGIIFLMCTQSAIFGPSKYGIIPELVPASALSRANSVLVGLSYLAIIIGTFIPSYLLLQVLGRNFLGLGIFCVGVAGVGILASLHIERTPPQHSSKHFSPLFFVEIYRTLRDVSRDRHLFLAIIGSAYFLFLGAFIQQNTLLYGQDYLGLGWIESGYLFPVAALGIGIGALLSGKLSGPNIEFGIVPIGALGLAVSALLLGVVTPSLHSIITLVAVIGISSGLFIVPLNAFIQSRSPANRRGEILASSSFLSFVGAALASGLLVLLNALLGLNPRSCFMVIGVLTAVMAIAAVIALPDFLVRLLVVLLTRGLYRIRTKGLEYLPVQGGALLVSNHVTWVDALLLSAATQRRIRFVMSREIAEAPWMRHLFKLMRVIPISTDDPPREILGSIKEARRALDEGYIVCIFAEGALTRNGNMQPFRPGLERIVKGSQHPIIPAYIGDAWGSIFSYHGGRLLGHLPKSIPYPIQLVFGRLLPSSSSAREVENAVREISGEAFALRKSAKRTLPLLFVQRARRRWFQPCMSDTTGKHLNHGHAFISAVALSRQIDLIAGEPRHVGVVFPASVGGALVNIATGLSGRIPVNLNFTASQQAVDSAVERCGIKTVFTSRAFLEKLGEFKTSAELVYLEDVLPKISRKAKLVATLKALLLPARFIVRGTPAGPDDPATVIFSSGSTGEPKGVVLTHHNIISNVESFAQVFNFRRDDHVCALLPFFHSFGYTVTLWTPLLVGFHVCYHGNPLEGTKVAEMVRERKLTILLATPTFLLAYIRRAKREDFASLRHVITGAEKLKQRLADTFEERFGLRPLEGYGATELSPAATINVPDVTIGRVTQRGTREGSIGRPIPGVAMKIVDPDSGATLGVGKEGLLKVKGPNVMQGYLGDPEKTAEVLQDGWYNTGDIARMDEDGFFTLVDRLSRYSKIGGEMVPHIAVEDVLVDALHAVGAVVAVTSAPDERKGEQLVVFYTPEVGEHDKLIEAVSHSSLPNLWRPRRENYFPLNELPKLGSGKLDLKRLREMAAEITAKEMVV